MDEMKTQKHPNFKILFYLASFFYATSLILFFVYRNSNQITVISDTLTVINNGFTSIMFVVLSSKYKLRSRRLALAWGLIATGQLLYLAGDVSWAFMNDVLNVSPYPSIADFMYLSYFLFFLVGAVILSEGESTLMGKIQRSLDLGIVLVSAVLFFLNFVVGPIIANSEGVEWQARALSIAYPVADMVMFYALLVLFYRRPKHLNVFCSFFLMLGMIVVIIADILFSLQTLSGSYSAGGIVDTAYISFYFLMSISAISQIHSLNAEKVPREKKRIQLFSVSRFSHILTYMPYLWFIAAFCLLVIRYFFELPMDFLQLSLGVSIVIILIIARQAIGVR
jgi:hypothetical protein